MPPFYRFAEVFLYAILSSAPFLFLALHPFRRQLRFSKTVTAVLCVFICLIQVALREISVFGHENPALFTAISTVSYAVFYFTAVNAPFGKTLFTLLILCNIANLIVIDSKCAEGLIFGREIAMQPYRWTASVTLLLFCMIILIPLFVYFREYYSKSISRSTAASSWNYLWLIPATFYIMWFSYCYGSIRTALEIAIEPFSAILTLCINLGAFLIYHTVIMLINEQEQNYNLVRQNHNMEIRNLQHDNLNKQIAATRQARHDIRHHIAVIDAYLADGEYEKLREYLQSYKKTLSDEGPTFYCNHYEVNILLSYFAQQAKESSIEFSVSAQLPESLSIPDNILSVLLGNLLENALYACMSVTDRGPWISVKAKTMPDAVFFQIENTCNMHRLKPGSDGYLSTKHEGDGIGLSSVKNIVEQYDGILEIEPADGIFRVSVLLNL